MTGPRTIVHTAETRAAADRARAELADRGIDTDAPPDAVTVPDWLAGRDALVRVEDAYRPITSEADLVDTRVDGRCCSTSCWAGSPVGSPG